MTLENKINPVRNPMLTNEAFSNRVKIIPIDQPFLRVLAEYFVDKFKDRIPDFSQTLVVFP